MNYLFWSFNRWARLQVNGKDGVGPRRSLVKQVISCSTIGLTLKEAVQSFLFIFTLDHSEPLHVHLTFSIIKHWNRSSSLFVRWHIWKHIKKEFIINFNVADFDGNLSIETAADFWKDVVNGAWNYSTVFVVLGASSHGKSLSRPSLSVAHNRWVVTVHNRWNGFLSTVLKYIFLRGVVQKFIKLKLPVFCLIVHMPAMRILWNRHLDCLADSI